MSRWKAASLHLALSILVIGAIGAALIALWYGWDLFAVMGGMRQLTILAICDIVIGPLLTLINVVRVGQVHFYYRATMLDDSLDPGPETIEARLFDEADIPWDEIAFTTVEMTLQRFFDDRRRGRFDFHCADVP